MSSNIRGKKEALGEMVEIKRMLISSAESAQGFDVPWPVGYKDYEVEFHLTTNHTTSIHFRFMVDDAQIASSSYKGNRARLINTQTVWTVTQENPDSEITVCLNNDVNTECTGLIRMSDVNDRGQFRHMFFESYRIQGANAIFSWGAGVVDLALAGAATPYDERIVTGIRLVCDAGETFFGEIFVRGRLPN